MPTRVITFANRKGGAGKTTAATTIAAGLAAHHRNVLLIDLDGQASVSRWLGLPRDNGAAALLTCNPKDKASIDLVNSRVVSGKRPNLWVLPGDEKTYDAGLEIRGWPISHLRDNLFALFFKRSIDYIVIDTQPGISRELQEMPVWAADYLIIPTTCAQSSLDGLYSLWDSVNQYQNSSSPQQRWNGKVLGVLINEYEEGRSAAEETILRVTEKCSKDAVLGPIHRAQIFKQMEGQGETLWEKYANSRAAREYAAVITRILRIG